MRNLTYIVLAILAGSCVSVLADEPDVPKLLQDKPVVVDIDEVMTMGHDDSRDERWHADVEDSLQFLYRRQLDILERLAKVEAAQIRVQTSAGEVTRAVPVRSGTGYFDLAPGEVLSGYQDPVTGVWTKVSQAAPKVVHANYASKSTGNRASYPVNVYSTPAMEMRVIPQNRFQPMRGRIRVRMGTCGPNGCP